MKRLLLPLVIIATLSGCLSMKQPHMSNLIGDAYATIETLASVVLLECGNTEPGGDCVVTSLLDRGDVNAITEDLQRAYDAVAEADRLYSLGQTAQAIDSLEAAQTVIAALKATLRLREVTYNERIDDHRAGGSSHEFGGGSWAQHGEAEADARGQWRPTAHS